MSAPPLIAVMPNRLAAGRVAGWAGSSEAISSDYLEALRRAGGVPVSLGGPADVDAAQLLAPFDAVVLTGGGDVDPARYGEVRRPEVYGINQDRDRFELALVPAALQLGLPVLGICRGAQVVNVALGGSLWQHLGEMGLPIAHGMPHVAEGHAWHPVDVVADSRLSDLLGGVGRIERCVSIHHQSVREVAPGLVVTGRSPDGLIEAVETPPAGPWCLGVQWHPERSAATDGAQQALFDGFVARAAAR